MVRDGCFGLFGCFCLDGHNFRLLGHACFRWSLLQAVHRAARGRTRGECAARRRLKPGSTSLPILGSVCAHSVRQGTSLLASRACWGERSRRLTGRQASVSSSLRVSHHMSESLTDATRGRATVRRASACLAGRSEKRLTSEIEEEVKRVIWRL